MKHLTALFCIALLGISALSAKKKETVVPGNLQMGDYGYLYCHMSDRGQWTAFALSRDGLHYHDLFHGDSVFSSFELARIEGGTRDAYICRKYDGSGYLMVTTDMNNSMTKRLNKGGVWENFGIDLLTSDDLMHWQSTTFDFRKGREIFSDGATANSVYKDWSTITRVWAPQIFWDASYKWPDGSKGGYFIYYSLWNPKEEKYDRMYYSYADKSFTQMTMPQLLFDWGYATIDADINYLTTDGKFHMMIKKEGGTPGLFTATAPALTGPWGEPVEDDYVNFEGKKKCEGVSAFQIVGEEGWRIAYIEYSSRPRHYRICKADANMRNFSDPQDIQGVTGPQHGSFMRLTQEEYERLEAWGNPKPQPSQWNGKRVGFLGDSMTDPRNRATQYHYYEYLRDSLGITPLVYARSGNQWNHIRQRAEEMIKAEGDNLDAIFIWAGTNDYNHGAPIGQFYTERDTVVDYNGKMVPRKCRDFIYTDSTFCGRINQLLSMLKHRYPTKQIIIMTPPHRGYANFSDPANNKFNVQPDENIANSQGLYLEDYVNTLKQAGQYWSVPVIDLFSLSGLFPMEPAHGIYFAEPDGYPNSVRYDRLHPSRAGHIRLGQTLLQQLQTLPVF